VVEMCYPCVEFQPLESPNMLYLQAIFDLQVQTDMKADLQV